MSKSKPGKSRTKAPRDIPPELLILARHIVRHCKQPGRYLILLDVPPLRNQPLKAAISKTETLQSLNWDE